MQSENKVYFFGLCLEMRQKILKNNVIANGIKIPELYEECKKLNLVKEQYRSFVESTYRKLLESNANVHIRSKSYNCNLP